MKKSIKLVSALVILAGLAVATSGLAASASPCAKTTGWHTLPKTNLNHCDGLSHFYHCKVTQVIFCNGSSKVFVNLKRIYHHGKFVKHSEADKKVVFDGNLDAKDACARVYKMDYQK